MTHHCIGVVAKETKRYRLKIATWTVVREPGQPSPRRRDSPEAVVELARDLLHDCDEDKEHFWVVLLNAQNHYLLAHLSRRARSHRPSCIRAKCSGLRSGEARRR
jgi:hypothetical protein